MHLVWPLLAGTGIGAAMGALLGASRACPDGGCPLTSSPRRGAIHGAILGFLLSLPYAVT